MLRKRLIFVLFYSDGYFVQSRNFRLQRVGDIDWLVRNYNFFSVAKCIDELMIIDLSTGKKLSKEFYSGVTKIKAGVHVPLTIGGGISRIEDCNTAFNEGADKVLINSAVFLYLDAVKEIIQKYGSQAVIGALDYRELLGQVSLFVKNGSDKLEMSLEDALLNLSEIEVGEILLNSIDKDGTGFGFDMSILNGLMTHVESPIIALGGAGNWKHFNEALGCKIINAVATGNLFNFVGDGLPKTRANLINVGHNLVNWID